MRELLSGHKNKVSIEIIQADGVIDADGLIIQTEKKPAATQQDLGSGFIYTPGRARQTSPKQARSGVDSNLLMSSPWNR